MCRDIKFKPYSIFMTEEIHDIKVIKSGSEYIHESLDFQ